MSTWPRGYTHPMKEWQFCPLQQGQHPTPAIPAAIPIPVPPVRPERPSITIPHRSTQSTSLPSGSVPAVAAMPPSLKSPVAAVPMLKFDKNRPLPPLPLRVEKRSSSRETDDASTSENMPAEKPAYSFLHSRKLSQLSRPLSSSSSSMASLRTTAPPQIQVPARKASTAKVEKLETTTPGLVDAQVITIQLDDTPVMPYAHSALPSSVALPATGFTGATSRKSRSWSLGSADEHFPKLNFSFLKNGRQGQSTGLDLKDAEVKIESAAEEWPASSMDSKRRTPPKLQLKIPLASSSPSPSPTAQAATAKQTPSQEPSRPCSRSVPHEEVVWTPGGYEERRYVYFPSPDESSPPESKPTSPTPTQSACTHDALALHPPPHHTRALSSQHPATPRVHEHSKKPSTSSSRSQTTFSTFGASAMARQDTVESQLTNYEDYEDDIDANYTCDSSIASSSSGSSSPSCDSDAENCLTPVQKDIPVGKNNNSSETVDARDGDTPERVDSLEYKLPTLVLPSPTISDPKMGDIAVGLRLSNMTLGDDLQWRLKRKPVSITQPSVLASCMVEAESSKPKPKIARRSLSTSRLSVKFITSPKSPSRASSCSSLKSHTQTQRAPAKSLQPSHPSYHIVASAPGSLLSVIPRSATATPCTVPEEDGEEAPAVVDSVLPAVLPGIEHEAPRPMTAPDVQRSQSFFEDDDDDDEDDDEDEADHETTLEKAMTRIRSMRRFFARCFTGARAVRIPRPRRRASSTSAGTSVVTSPGSAVVKVDDQFQAIRRNLGQIQDALAKYRERGLEDMPVPPPAVVQMRVSAGSSTSWRRWSSRLL
ncbi:hypothetical protein ABW21_db0205888 [Orbilia brochopaga]|nr:hypothetical protein ABW21_db0205888 [Drechslerella brochopaga]